MDAPTRAASASLLLAVLTLAPAGAEEPPEPPSLLGPVTREEIEAAEPTWVTAEAESDLELEAARALAAVEPGADVTVYFGTWCSDSRRELARFWRALDENLGIVPFEVDYIAVGRFEKRPPELLRDLDLRYVPTFIVRRDGREVGRMVEESPHGIERDLLGLLDGSAAGVLSARDDLGEPPAPAEGPGHGAGGDGGRGARPDRDDDTRIELNAVDPALFELPPEVTAAVRSAAPEVGG